MQSSAQRHLRGFLFRQYCIRGRVHSLRQRVRVGRRRLGRRALELPTSPGVRRLADRLRPGPRTKGSPARCLVAQTLRQHRTNCVLAPWPNDLNGNRLSHYGKRASHTLKSERGCPLQRPRCRDGSGMSDCRSRSASDSPPRDLKQDAGEDKKFTRRDWRASRTTLVQERPRHISAFGIGTSAGCSGLHFIGLRGQRRSLGHQAQELNSPTQTPRCCTVFGFGSRSFVHLTDRKFGTRCTFIRLPTWNVRKHFGLMN